MEAVAEEKGFAPNLGELETARLGEPEWLADRRHEARERFESLGFPTAKLEAWRYTGVGPIAETPWRLDRSTPGPTVRIRGSSDGVRVLRLAQALEEEPERLAASLGRIAGSESGAFAALNQALSECVVVIVIAKEAVVESPIEILYDAEAASGPVVTYPRCLVLAGERSQAAVVERFVGQGTYFRDAVTEIALEDGAVLDHDKLQQEGLSARHVHTIAVRQGRATRFVSRNFALGAALARTDIRVRLEGEGAECRLDGLFAGSGAQHLDNHTTIDHATTHTTSREIYKGILDGHSRGVFHGTIVVRPHAQKTDAIQTNKNLLLSREALVNTTPALEIFADDVRCKHGSTIGQLDANALFYLRSRGLEEAEARRLLTWAFAADIAEGIRIPWVRAEVEEALGQKLPGALRPENRP
jgi:Fe-S cluster assembly protein SufD